MKTILSTGLIRLCLASLSLLALSISVGAQTALLLPIPAGPNLPPHKKGKIGIDSFLNAGDVAKLLAPGFTLKEADGTVLNRVEILKMYEAQEKNIFPDGLAVKNQSTPGINLNKAVLNQTFSYMKREKNGGYTQNLVNSQGHYQWTQTPDGLKLGSVRIDQSHVLSRRTLP